MKDATTYDRTIEDLGNVVTLEHVNTRVPDQQLATLFYVTGLGLTRDPYLMTSVTNMWVNVGRSQFHLPTGKPQVLRGHTGLVIPNREALVRRLGAVKKPLEGTRFAFTEHNDYVEVDLPVGQPHPLLRARRAVRPDAARHALCGARGAARHARRHRPLLSRDAEHACRAWQRTGAGGMRGPRSAPASI